jgi:Tfp pilus assembly protein PilO
VTLTERDRKLVMIIVPLVAVLAYWFLLFSPKRQEASSLAEKVTQAQQERDQAEQMASRRTAAKSNFAADYAAVVRVGKAVPASVDMPSLLVQLDRSVAGTGIKFDKIVAGERTSAAGDSSGGSGGESAPSGGGSKAASAPGKAAESAEGAKDTANAGSAKTDKASNEAGGSSSPAAGGSASAAAAPPGLEVVPLTMTFSGSFFDLSDFMHRLKRFVRVSDDRVVVRGRLMQVQSLKLTPQPGLKLTAELTANVYLSPKAEGATAGATPQGPADATPAASQVGGTTSTPPAAAATR